ncbi:MAG: tetratricopeptide repeat protein, partial [Terriglobales bacterium]
RGQNDVVKQAAAAGARAAQQAATLAPDNAEAQRLQGSLLGEMISVGGTMAGMRYGARSGEALEKAMALAPNDPKTLTSRAIGYLFTPAMFGGSKTKATQLLRKAVSIDPGYDTAYIWLAQAELMQNQSTAAMSTIQAALKINPERRFAQYVHQQVEAKQKKG